MTTWEGIKSLTISQKIIQYSMNVKQGYSIWLGGLVRIDFLSGEDKFFTFFLSPNVTIHKTSLFNSEEIYAKHAGVLLRPILSKDIKVIILTIYLNCYILI